MWRSTGWFFRLHKSKGLPCPTFSLQLQACLVFTACIQHFLELQTYLVFTACIQHFLQLQAYFTFTVCIQHFLTACIQYFLQLQAYLVFTASAASTLLVARTIRTIRECSRHSEEGPLFFITEQELRDSEGGRCTRAQLMDFVGD